MVWLRQLLEPSLRDGAEPDLLAGLQAEVFEDRVFALSPKGEVVDLPKGATPLDFAYQVHTNLGHRCRGARVNGRMVTLDYKLSNGDTVEIIPSKQPHPSRDWLLPQLGFLASPRSRAKVRGWFRKQDEDAEPRAGPADARARTGPAGRACPAAAGDPGRPGARRMPMRCTRASAKATSRWRRWPARCIAGCTSTRRCSAARGSPSQPRMAARQAWSSTASATC